MPNERPRNHFGSAAVFVRGPRYYGLAQGSGDRHSDVSSFLASAIGPPLTSPSSFEASRVADLAASANTRGGTLSLGGTSLFQQIEAA